MTTARAERAAERLALLRGIVRRCSSYHDAYARLGNVGETWVSAKAVYRRHGLRIGDDLAAECGPPYPGMPTSSPEVVIVDDAPPETLPSEDIPVFVDDETYVTEAPTTPPPPPVGWTVEEPEERILFVPDVHVPFHDVVAWGVMMQVAKRLRPHRIVVLGDFLDFFQCSDHEKDPRRNTTVAADVAEAKVLLGELANLGADRLHFIEGNHEKRLRRYLMTRAPALLDSVDLPAMLGLREAGWTWTPYHEHLRIGDLHVTHDTGHAGATAAQRSSSDFMGSVVLGHTHRIGVHAFGNALGQRFVSAMFGWLGSVPEADYLPLVKRMKDWSHGFGIGYRMPSGHVALHAVPIVDGAAVVDGAVVRMAG